MHCHAIRIATQLFTGTVLLSIYTFAWGQKQIEPDKVIKRSQEILVTDEKGVPVPGVLLEPFGMNSSYFWPEALMGKAVPQKTNEKGIVSLPYPVLFADSVGAQSIDCAVSHPRFVGSIARLKIAPGEPTRHVLQTGISLKIEVVDSKGNPLLEKLGVVMSGDVPPRTWTQTKNIIESHEVSDGLQQFMVVQPVPNGKTQFSDTMSRAFQKGDIEKGVQYEKLELSEGVRIIGTLSPNVSRPVKEGYVIAFQYPLPIPQSRELNLQPLTWHDWVPIQEDGTFEFPSLPRSGKVQLIAECHGWSGMTDSRTTVGETIDIIDDDMEVTLDLRPTFEVTFKFVDDQGLPLAGVAVGFSPNQSLKDWGTQILGSRVRSILEVRRLLGEDVGEQFSHMDSAKRFHGTSGEDGVVRVCNLPNGLSSYRYSAGKKGYVFTNDALEASEFKEQKAIKEIILKRPNP